MPDERHTATELSFVWYWSASLSACLRQADHVERLCEFRGFCVPRRRFSVSSVSSAVNREDKRCSCELCELCGFRVASSLTVRRSHLTAEARE